MQRLLILFLMLLLPLQVFAGGVNTHIALGHQVESGQVSMSQQQLRDVADLIAFDVSAIGTPGASDDCCVLDDESAEFNLHADSGDEAVPTYGFRFTSDMTSLSPALSNDNASEPPFLPLIAPPPRA